MDTQQPVHVVLMGVSGCGKTSVASGLHERLNWPYAEADDFHPQANKDKMAAGHALNDEDRWPWLRTLQGWMTEHASAGQSTIVTCSALKKTYRELLAEAEGNVVFVHLNGPMELIEDRMSHRAGHFMPTSLLPSQFATLEPLQDGENGLTLDVSQTPDQLIDATLAALNLQ
ncbi:gluconokinase [Staphylococcus chromogenes]|nr:gluconokinase [Staphylococcus chromogenes]